MEHVPVPSHLRYVIIHCGTNNVSKDSASEIANSILRTTLILIKRNPCLKAIITGIFPRDETFSRFHIIVPQINQLLKIFTFTYDFTDFLEPTKGWLKCNGDLNNKLFSIDHLSRYENKKIASPIFTLLKQYKIALTYRKLVPVIVHVTLLLTSPLPKFVTFSSPVKVFVKISPIHVDVAHVTTDAIVRHWNEISLCRPRILPALVTHVGKVRRFRKLETCPQVS